MKSSTFAACSTTLVVAVSLLSAPALRAARPVPVAAPAHYVLQEPEVILQQVRDLPRNAAYLGPANCESCHEPNGRHGDEFTWYTTQDGVSGTNRLHKNALNQLSDTETQRQSESFARAIDPQVSDWIDFVYQPTGPCARCHATVVNGYADYGVSCESCHGAAQNYLEPHKEPNNRAAAIAAGLWDIYGKPETWGAVCMDCHVLGNQALIDAGHPSGADFDLGVKFQTTALHFLENRSTYAAGDITNLGNGYMATIRATLRADPLPPVAPPVNPPVDPLVNPPVDPLVDPPVDPLVDPPVDPPVVPPRSVPPRPSPPPQPAIFDGNGTLVRVDPELRVVDSLPPTPAAVVAAVQGRLATVLRLLLDRGATSPVRITPAEDPVPYSGADAQLLRLQQEIIALALQALSTPPKQEQQ